MLLLVTVCDSVGNDFCIMVGSNTSSGETNDSSFFVEQELMGTTIGNYYNVYTRRKDIAEDIECLREENMSSFRLRLKTVWICLCVVVSLLLCKGILLYLYRESKRKIRANQLEIETLKDERDCTRHEKLELIKALGEQKSLGSSTKIIINQQLSILNGLIASEISGNKSYATAYRNQVESIHRNRSEFIESTKQMYFATYPKFRKYIDDANLEENEKSIICLYALGLRGKEIGQYIRMKGFYNLSSSIRKKLGINEHETNLGPYIRKLIEKLSQEPA